MPILFGLPVLQQHNTMGGAHFKIAFSHPFAHQLALVHARSPQLIGGRSHSLQKFVTISEHQFLLHLLLQEPSLLPMEVQKNICYTFRSLSLPKLLFPTHSSRIASYKPILQV